LGSDTPPVDREGRPHNTLDILSPDWGFHSGEESLAEFARWLSENGVRVVLFHNLGDNYKKFIKRNGLDQARVWVAAKGCPIDLRQTP